ncbi:LppC family lipoprotein [Duganella sp. Leaf126]|nr:LppC family lipoprotein [Duganella sp. Leaf126]
MSGCGSSVPIIISPPPLPAPVPLPPPPPEPPPPAAEVFAVEMPGAAATPTRAPDTQTLRTENAVGYPMAGDDVLPATAPVRIGLILPLRSETLGAAAEALRAGFMAAWERDRDNITVTVVETGDVAQDSLASYAQTLEGVDLVVGPLARSAVTAVANSALVTKPTIALNSPENGAGAGAAPLPQQMLAMGLSIEEEARQVAQWAAAEQPGASAMIVTTSTPWQRRIAAAFAAHWQQLGQQVRMVELSAPNNYLSDPDLVQLRARLQQDPPGLLFSAMGADQTRQLRGALTNGLVHESDEPVISTADGLPAAPTTPTVASGFAALPLYGTSALNAGSGMNSPTNELDGVRLLDLPWQVQRDHPAVMVYPHPVQAGTADMERLYALGIDAYRVARKISRQPAGRFQIDGVTGRLTVDFGQGPSRFERVEQPAVFRHGAPQAVQQ